MFFEFISFSILACNVRKDLFLVNAFWCFRNYLNITAILTIYTNYKVNSKDIKRPNNLALLGVVISKLI
jgi:hypothetical protein